MLWLIANFGFTWCWKAGWQVACGRRNTVDYFVDHGRIFLTRKKFFVTNFTGWQVTCGRRRQGAEEEFMEWVDLALSSTLVVMVIMMFMVVTTINIIITIIFINTIIITNIIVLSINSWETEACLPTKLKLGAKLYSGEEGLGRLQVGSAWLLSSSSL